MCLHCIRKVSHCSIKSCGRSWSAHEGTIYAYTNILLGKNCQVLTAVILSKIIFSKQNLSCICSMCLNCIGKVSNCSIKSCGRSWSAHEGTIYAYTNILLGKNCQVLTAVILSKILFLNQTPSCICSMILLCMGKVSKCSIKSCGRSWSAHEGTISAYTKAILGKNCLSSNSCHFVKDYCSLTKLLHAYVQCVYIV